MKINRQGQAKVLTEQELHDLFTIGLLTPRDRLLFGICLYTGCRIGEACSLAWADVTSDAMTFRIEKTKTKSSRTVAISPALQVLFGVTTEKGKKRTLSNKKAYKSRVLASRYASKYSHQ